MPDEEEIKVEIPWDQLSTDTLLGVIDDFVLREGTEYGAVEVPLARKRDQVMAMLKSGKASLMFDARSETCTIVAREAWVSSRSPSGTPSDTSSDT